MKRIRTIFSALSTLGSVPSTEIIEAWAAIKKIAESATMDNTGEKAVPAAFVNLINSFIAAVVAIAKDDEDKAIDASKADKP